MIPQGLQWNQADISGCPHYLNEGLIILIAFKSNRSPRILGSGFIIHATNSEAVVVTAAHNFEGVRKIQSSNRNQHPTALPEFTGNLTSIDLDPKKVRALCMNNSGIEMTVIEWALWDKSTDTAFFAITTQDDKSNYFDKAFLLETPELSIGTEVALLGFSELEVSDEVRDGRGHEAFSLKQKLLLRKGRITRLHPDGHSLCRGACIETSIPVFSGMSGGPVFRTLSENGDIKPFGLISSDLECDNDNRKNDRSYCGSSIIALLDAEVTNDPDSYKVQLKVYAPEFQQRDNSNN